MLCFRSSWYSVCLWASGFTNSQFLSMPLTLYLFVSFVERVPDSSERRGHICSSGSWVHRALAEKCVGIRSSLWSVTLDVVVWCICFQVSLLLFNPKNITYICLLMVLFVVFFGLHACTWFIMLLFTLIRKRINTLRSKFSCLKVLSWHMQYKGDCMPTRETERRKRQKEKLRLGETGNNEIEGWGLVEKNVAITLSAGKCSAWSRSRTCGNWVAGNELRIKSLLCRHLASISVCAHCTSFRWHSIIQRFSFANETSQPHVKAKSVANCYGVNAEWMYVWGGRTLSSYLFVRLHIHGLLYILTLIIMCGFKISDHKWQYGQESFTI